MAEELSSHSNKKMKLAILPFESSKEVSEADSVLAYEKLSIELFKRSEFELIERKSINKILKEKTFNLSGLTDSDSKKLGKLLSVDSILLGSLTVSGKQVHLFTRIIDTETSKIISTSHLDFPETDSSKNISNTEFSISDKQSDSNSKEIVLNDIKTELHSISMIKKPNSGKIIGLIKNKSKVNLSGYKIYANLFDNKKNIIDTVNCLVDKILEVDENVGFSCTILNFPESYSNYQVYYDPLNNYLANYVTKLEIKDDKFSEINNFSKSYAVNGIVKNNSDYKLKHIKIIIQFFSENNKFIGSVYSFANKTSLDKNEDSSFKVSIYDFQLDGLPKKYKIQTQALAN
jgi:TolB-like protein